MSDMFEVVDSIPSGASGRHADILREFMKRNAHRVKLVDPENVRTNTLTLLANHGELPIRVYRRGTDIYLERTDVADEAT